MWSLDLDNDNEDDYTYAVRGDETHPNRIETCQERRPGGIWESSSLQGKDLGNDLTDCGGLCCNIDPNTGVCSLDNNFGISLEYPHYQYGPENDADKQEQLAYCIDGGFSGCSCLCYGKKEGDYVLLFPPPPVPPAAPPPFCPMVNVRTNVWVDTANADQFLHYEWGPVPQPTVESGGNSEAGTDITHIVNIAVWEASGRTLADFEAHCCGLCVSNNQGLSWRNSAGVSVSDQCDTIQIRSAPSFTTYECEFLSSTTSAFHIEAIASSVPDISIVVRSNAQIPEAPPPPTVPPATPPGFVMCTGKGDGTTPQNMFCEDETDTDNTDKLFDGDCYDLGDTYDAPTRGYDCGTPEQPGCGGRCCSQSSGCAGGADWSWEDCDCFGAYEGEIRSVTVTGSNRMFLRALPPPNPNPPPPPFGHCSVGADHVTTVAQGTTCTATGTTVSSAACTVLIDGDTSDASPFPFELINSLTSSVTIDFGTSPLDINHISVYHAGASSSSNPMRMRRVSVQLFDVGGAAIAEAHVYRVQPSGQIPLIRQYQAVGKLVLAVVAPFPSAPSTASYTISDVRVANRCANTPPSPPVSTCTPNNIDMQSTVVSCHSTSDSPGSHCNNVYDGVHDALNSFFHGHGSDTARSWVANSVTHATIRLTFAHTISFNYVDIWQRLYHGLEHQVTKIGLQLFGNHDEIVSYGGQSIHYLDLATINNTNDHQSFVSRILFWDTVGGIRKIEVIVLEAMDPDDVGIAEIEMGTRCDVESPPPPPFPPVVLLRSSSSEPSEPSSSGVVTHHGLLDGAVVGSAQLVNSNVDTCSSYCAVVSAGSIFNIFLANGGPSSWIGCRCFDPTTTTLRANSTSFGYGVGVYSLGLSLSTYASVITTGNAFKSVAEAQTVDDSGLVTASSAFKVHVSIETGSSMTAAFHNLVAVSAPFSSSPSCMPCVDSSSTGIRARIQTNEWTASAIAEFAVSNSRIFDVVVELHNRVLVIRITDFSNGEEHSGSTNLIFSGAYGPIEPMAIYAGKTVGGVSIDPTGSVNHDTVLYTDTLGSHEVASFGFESGHLFLNGAKFGPGFTAPPLFQASLAYPERFTNIAAVGSGAACFEGTNGLVVNSDLSSFWSDTSAGGLTVCTSVVAFTQNALFPTLLAIGNDVAFNLFSYTHKIGTTLEHVDYESGTPGTLQQNEKTHVCMSVSTNHELSFYRNATRIARQTAPFDGVAATSKIALGADPFVDGTVRGLVGCLSNVRVWSRVLSDSEVAVVAAAAA